MRIVPLVCLAALCLATMGGCAGVMLAERQGGLYGGVSEPLPMASYYAPAAQSAERCGTATMSSILGIITTGDASIKAAMEAGGITKIHHIDQSCMNIFQLYATYTIKVYGE